MKMFFARSMATVAGLVLASACAISFTAAPSAAKTPAVKPGVIYCEFKPARGAWLPTLVELTLQGDEVGLRDDLTEYFKVKGQKARVDIDNTKRTTYVWTLKDFKDRVNNHAKFSYRLTIQKATLQASISGKPLGYENHYEAQGMCTGY